ncbi:glycosylation-dependent cell adhesion molecule 1-like [Sorex araneus]|uniref:glycosylation-dependent cell adhesion molecule 1-like n=1 Tax=Sorex araneus TaxID=42254 RepID=UPI0024335B11|nr:glycosylation-dependent cell adhesion molecule 1-like [Sorex araneus]
MKFLIVLLLASLAYASPVPNAAAAQLKHRGVHPEKAQVSSEDLFTESSISKEEIVSKDDAAIKSVKKVIDSGTELLHSIAQKVFKKVDLKLEESEEHIPKTKAAIISEGKLAEFVEQIKKDLNEALKKFADIVNKFLPPIPKAEKP